MNEPMEKLARQLKATADAMPETKPVTSVEAQTVLLDAAFRGKYTETSIRMQVAASLLLHHDLMSIGDELERIANALDNQGGI